MKHVVIVGSGTGGTFAANLLAKQLRSRIKNGEVSIELVGESDEHV
ncbi:MAG TPA: NAD(P)/FAD-dependent oxidoreductase, partial [Aigarchaeota archaeon]|nr:NAD(P)/FAD-dependent oxidoreductase [Aigarchaeota archaeon]